MGRRRHTQRSPGPPTPRAGDLLGAVEDLLRSPELAPVHLLNGAHELAMTVLAASKVPNERAVVIVVDPREECGKSVMQWVKKVRSRGCEPYARKLQEETDARMAEGYTTVAMVLELDQAMRIFSKQRNVNALFELKPPPSTVRAIGITKNKTAVIHMNVRPPVQPVADA